MTAADHQLIDNGRAYDWTSLRRTIVGPARCSCGVTSSVLASDAARKRWHEAHVEEDE